jgi:hypothetical protein
MSDQEINTDRIKEELADPGTPSIRVAELLQRLGWFKSV